MNIMVIRVNSSSHFPISPSPLPFTPLIRFISWSFMHIFLLIRLCLFACPAASLFFFWGFSKYFPYSLRMQTSRWNPGIGGNRAFHCGLERSGALDFTIGTDTLPCQHAFNAFDCHRKLIPTACQRPSHG